MLNIFSLIPTVLAEGIDLTPKESSANFQSLAGITFSEIVSGLIAGALVIAAIIFFFMLVIGGIKWILSGGDKGQTESARNQITAALVGLVIVFSAWAIAQLIQTFFGVRILGGELEIPTIQ